MTPGLLSRGAPSWPVPVNTLIKSRGVFSQPSALGVDGKYVRKLRIQCDKFQDTEEPGVQEEIKPRRDQIIPRKLSSSIITLISMVY